MAKRHAGRKKGGHNRGFFYRKGRGWYVTEGSRMVPLRYENGEPIKDQAADERDVKDAHARWLLDRQVKPETAAESTVTVLEVCKAYLKDAKANGAAKTYEDRADTLFDLCFGVPPAFRTKGEAVPKRLTAARREELNASRIHEGYGQRMAHELLPLDITEWLNAHTTWGQCGRRSRIQAVKRAFNFAVEQGLIQANPIRGFKMPKSKGRVTHITPEQEQAIYQYANPALALAVRVCIRTGARFGTEFVPLTAKHVTDHGDRMEWNFTPSEIKTRKKRVIRITDPEIIRIVRGQIKEYPQGPIFRDTKGNPWDKKNLSQRFQFLKKKRAMKGLELDADCCMYSCRHTYAKRTLQGYWTGRPTNTETLAKLMGNSVQVCRDHYFQWSDIDNEHLWEAT
jgi:integrase